MDPANEAVGSHESYAAPASGYARLMCCFSRRVKFVGKTRIFARGEPNGDQIVVYAMDLEIDTELAMVLPIPVRQGSPDDAVTFVSLEGYPNFFDDLEAAFPDDYLTVPQAKGSIARSAAVKPKLVVFDVSMFEASFVPTRADFARLDERFRLPEGVWDCVPRIADFGFAVFRLKPKKRSFFGFGSRKQSVHPMAFRFPRNDPRELFFPTLHVHDGDVGETAHFDHTLFCQADGVLDATLAWAESKGPLASTVSEARARGLIDGSRLGRRNSLFGTLPNADVVLRAPEGVALEDLEGRGESFVYRVRATAAHFGESMDPSRAPWKATATQKLGALCRVLRDDLAALTAERRDAWALTTFDEALPAHFMNGPQLWSGTTYRDGTPATSGGPGRVAMRIFTDHVEPQDITLAFATLPDEAKLRGIMSELRRLVDRAVS